MKKICILQNGMYYGGTDVFVLNLVKGLVQDGHQVIVVLPLDSSTVTPREAELVEIGATIKKTEGLQNGVIHKLRHLKRLYQLLKTEKPDVFQANIDLFNGPNMLVAWLAGIPIRECHSHNSQQDRELAQGRTLAIRVYQKMMRWMCWKFSNRRCGCSGIAMDFLFGEKWKSDKYSRVIHNGIDFSDYLRDLNLEKKKRELDLKRKYNICTVGRMSYQKNPLFIVEVMNALFELRNDCDFIWIGSGDMEQEVRNRIDKFGIAERMHLLGNRHDVPELLRSMDMFFLPSYFEGLAIVLIEAQAAGLPCVTTTTTPPESNCGSLLYIPLEKSEIVWAQKISDILDGKIKLEVDPVKLNKYSIECMVKEMEEVFE